MAYQSVEGVIESVGRSGKIIKLNDGNWYSAFSTAQLRGARQGDEVSFQYDEKRQGDKTFLNIKGDVTVLGGEAPPRQERAPARSSAPAREAPQQSSYTPREGSVTEAQRQASIQRQVALKAAVELAAAKLAADPSLEIDEGWVVDAAITFTAFLDGN